MNKIVRGASTSPKPEGGSGGSAATDSSYSATVFFEPKSKYIWALALDKQGRLYVGTGDRGEIFRVDPSGKASLFFQSDESQVRVLDFDRAGNLIAGTDGSGLVYRISPQGEGFVLYSAPKKEITALAVDAQGNIYAARSPADSSTQCSYACTDHHRSAGYAADCRRDAGHRARTVSQRDERRRFRRLPHCA